MNGKPNDEIVESMLKETFPAALAAERSLDRRRFVIALGVAVLTVLGGKRLARRLEDRYEPQPALPHAAVKDLSPRTARSFRRPEGEALAVRLDDDTVVAFDRRCPHLGCPVVWAAERSRFECPCHHAAFDARTGAVLFGPPRRGLVPVAVMTPTTKETTT